VTGNVAPEIMKPAPLTDADLTITGAVPVEVKIKGCVDGVLSATFPNGRFIELTVNVALEAVNCRGKLLETPPALAVRVTICDDETDKTFAVNPVPIALAGINTAAGTTTAALLLARFTPTPPSPAAALRVTRQLVFPDPVIDALPHESAFNVADPFPA
jgi:hypothetical protein